MRFPQTEDYLGFGVTDLGGIPRVGARLILVWRNALAAPEMQVIARERNDTLEVEYGEIFAGTMEAPHGAWTQTVYPLSGLTASPSAEVDDALEDGVLDTSRLRSLALTFPPGPAVLMEIREARLEWDGYSGDTLFVLAILSGIGFLLFLRSGSAPVPVIQKQLIAPEIAGRAVFILMSVSLLYLLWLNGGWLAMSSTALYGVLGGLVLTEEFVPGFWARFRIMQLRYAAVLLGAWLFGVDLTAMAWMMIAPAAYLPALQFGDNLLIVLLPLLGFAGYLLGADPAMPNLELAIFSLAVTFVTALLAREALFLAARRTDAEEKLRRSEATYQEIFDAVDEGILLLNPETGEILQANEPAGRILGCSRQSLEMAAIWQIAPNARSLLETALRGTASTIQELEARRSDGTPFWAEILVQHSPVGGERRAILVLRDIEERRRLESQAQLSQKMEAVGNLAGGVAHDFNNLLTVINGQTELAIAAAGADLQASLQDIHAAGLRAVRLVEQLLAYSRKQMLQLRPVDLSEVISGMQPRLSQTAGEGIKQEYRYPKRTATVLADVRQVEQVLTNLVANARDAMPGDGTLCIMVRNRSLVEGHVLESVELEPGPYVEVRVSDTGRGMGEETLARIFDPFFTTQEFGRGAGLGLSTAYGIVRQHSGGIRVESAPGRGTTFSVFFPCAARN